MTLYCPTDPQPEPVNAPYMLECVVVCAGYTDFLRHTLPQNKALFDRLVVVTDWEDTPTRKLCEFYHVQCIPTDVLETRKGHFCKGKGINVGLAALSQTDWVLHLDADIWLPPQTRILLERMKLNKNGLYGVDRFNVTGANKWNTFLTQPQLQQENEGWVHLSNNTFPLGTRVIHKETGGYVPIGFFQLWNPSVSQIHTYPEGRTDAGAEDFRFAMQWPRADRHLLPEIVAYHLESEGATMGANWFGRKTSPFVIKGEGVLG